MPESVWNVFEDAVNQAESGYTGWLRCIDSDNDNDADDYNEDEDDVDDDDVNNRPLASGYTGWLR